MNEPLAPSNPVLLAAHTPEAMPSFATHQTPSFFARRKWLLIVFGILIVGVGFLFGRMRAARNAPVQYETQAVTKGELTQTVTVTGAVKSASIFDLNFEAGGKVAAVFVQKGDMVKAGTVLASLESTEFTLSAEQARARLAEAEANLQKALAGATPEDIRVKEAAVAEAEAGMTQASTTLANTMQQTALDIETADLEVQKAQAEYDTAVESLDDAKRSLAQTLQKDESTQFLDFLGSAVAMAAVGTDMDNILGVDNTTANDTFETALGTLNPATLPQAKDAYGKARDARIAFENALAVVRLPPGAETLATLLAQGQSALQLSATALGKTRILLDATTPNSTLTASELTTKKTTIDTDRTSINTKSALLVTGANTAAQSRLTQDATIHTDTAAVNAARIALLTAKHNLTNAQLQAHTRVASEQASLLVATARRDAAAAALAQMRAAVRLVDRAPLDAAIAQARVAAESAAANVSKTEIRAPTDGVVTDIAINVGELAAAKAVAISMLSTHYEIEADIPEVDVAKVRVGQTVDITLDALGMDTHLPGTVLSVNPAETVIQDIVYYKMRVVFSKDLEVVKPGMTANVTVDTNRKTDVLAIPLRAVQEKGTDRIVRVFENEQPEDRVVKLGLRGDGGLVEILSGLGEGEMVIVGQTSK
jgi:HlyD family secretion protein